MSSLLRTAPGRALMGVVVLGLLATVGWYLYEAMRPAKTNLIRPSYAFDVTDRYQLAGYAENVFVGRVTGIAGVDDAEQGPYSIFDVEVEEALKGALQGKVQVRQLGGTVGKDVWVVDHDQLLVVGQTYVLATRSSQKQKNAQMLVAGTVSHQAVSSSSERESAVTQWRDAITNQRWPETLPSPAG